MKLLRVELEDFRCFGKVDFDFSDPTNHGEPSNVALLVGKNGAGKSAFLQAVAGFFGGLPALKTANAEPLQITDIREETKQSKLRATWNDLIEEDGALNKIQLRGEVTIDRTSNPEPIVIADEVRNGALASVLWSQNITAPGARPTGLITFFDLYRLLPTLQVEGPNLKKVPKHRVEQALAPTLRRDGRFDTRFSQLKQWIVNIDFIRAKAKADYGKESPLWETLRKALNTILGPYTFERVNERFEVLFRTPTGLVPLEALSDGFRSIFVIITDLLLRLSLSTPDPEKILEQEAVCLIDEIDAHLHPAWQLKVIPALTTLFPNVQFIATTHSALVISTVAPHQIFILEDREDT